MLYSDTYNNSAVHKLKEEDQYQQHELQTWQLENNTGNLIYFTKLALVSFCNTLPKKLIQQFLQKGHGK